MAGVYGKIALQSRQTAETLHHMGAVAAGEIRAAAATGEEGIPGEKATYAGHAFSVFVRW